MKLQQIQVITRHGARSPVYWTRQRFKDFPHLPEHEWDEREHSLNMDEVGVRYKVLLPDGAVPTFSTYDSCPVVAMKGGCKSGQLTSTGRNRQFQLGKILSQRYRGLVSSTFSADETYIRSTYYERTLMSALYFLSGFYDGVTNDETFLIETKNREQEDMFANKNRCPELDGWIAHKMSRGAYTQELQEAEDELNHLLGKKEGVPNATIHQINDLVRCYRGHGFTVPACLDENIGVMNKLEMNVMSTMLGRGNVDIQRLCIGSFLHSLVSRIKEAATLPSYRMMLYSAHDWTIISLLMAMGVEIEEWPTFSSYLVLELYQGGLLRVLYNDQSLNLSSGSEFVHVSEFFNLVNSVSLEASDSKARCLNADEAFKVNRN